MQSHTAFPDHIGTGANPAPASTQHTPPGTENPTLAASRYRDLVAELILMADPDAPRVGPVFSEITANSARSAIPCATPRSKAAMRCCASARHWSRSLPCLTSSVKTRRLAWGCMRCSCRRRRSWIWLSVGFRGCTSVRCRRRGRGPCLLPMNTTPSATGHAPTL